LKVKIYKFCVLPCLEDMSAANVVHDARQSLDVSTTDLAKVFPFIPLAQRKTVSDAHNTKLGRSIAHPAGSRLYSKDMFPPYKVLVQRSENVYRLKTPEYPQMVDGFELVLYPALNYPEFGDQVYQAQNVDAAAGEEVFYTRIRKIYTDDACEKLRVTQKPSMRIFVKEGRSYVIERRDLTSTKPETVTIDVKRSSISYEQAQFLNQRATGFVVCTTTK
jgi:hypothetical protein